MEVGLNFRHVAGTIAQAEFDSAMPFPAGEGSE